MEGQNLTVTSPSIPSQSSRHISSAIDTSGSPSGSRGKRKISSGEKGSVESMFNAQAKEKCEASIGRFFVANGIPYNAARFTYYKQMVKDILSMNSSFVPPGEHKLRTTILDEEYSKVALLFEDMRRIWVRTGCSIVMDGWTDVRHRPLINIIVTSPASSYFLRAIDSSGKKKDADFQFTILRDAIEEIGPSNVVQVITDSAPMCKSVGLMIEGAYRHIFWTPCVHSLNNALKDIGKIE